MCQLAEDATSRLICVLCVHLRPVTPHPAADLPIHPDKIDRYSPSSGRNPEAGVGFGVSPRDVAAGVTQVTRAGRRVTNPLIRLSWNCHLQAKPTLIDGC